MMEDLNQLLQPDEALLLKGARLQKEVQQAEEKLRTLQKQWSAYDLAMFHIQGLRQGVRVPRILGDTYLEYWLLRLTALKWTLHISNSS